MQIAPGARDYWSGAISWEEHGGLSQPWRILPEFAPLVDSAEFTSRAKMPSAVRCSIRTDARALSFTLNCDSDHATALDLLVDDQLAQRATIEPGPNDIRWSLDGAPHRVEIWLPQSFECQVSTIGLQDASFAEPGHAPGSRPTWLAYGSSITHCRGDAGPSDIWPARVAREQGWDLTSFALGGQCHLDGIVAESMAQMPSADLISLCLGVNIYGAASLGPRTFISAICGFARRLRLVHTTSPIVLIGPIYSPERERNPNQVGMTLEDYRGDVRRAAELLRQAGDDSVFFIDGREIIGAPEAGYLRDGLHPSPDAFALMAQRFAQQVRTRVEVRA